MIAITRLPSPAMNECVRTFVGVEPIDAVRAFAQHLAYRRMLERAGARVVVLEANPAHPDGVFVEDTAVVVDELAVIASMGTPSRRDEPIAIETELRKHRDRIVRVMPPATLEGGDVLRIGRTMLVGVTSRTNRAGIEMLAGAVRPFGYDVRAIRVEGCLHLKTGCTALPDGSLLVQPRWIDARDLEGFSLVPVPEREPEAANVVLIGSRVCLAAAHPETADLVRKRGFDVDSADLSEFAKAEGSATCLSILVE